MASDQSGRQVAIPRAGRAKPPSLAPHLVAERAIQDLGPVNWLQAIPASLSLDLLCRQPDPRGYVEDLCRHCPADEMLVSVITSTHAALGEVAHRDLTRTAVALLFDARARQPANPDAYINALVFDLVDLGFQPGVVAGACQRLRREMVFVPEIAEVLAMCERVRTSYRAAANVSQRALDAHGAALDVLRRYEEGERPQRPGQSHGGW